MAAVNALDAAPRVAISLEGLDQAAADAAPAEFAFEQQPPREYVECKSWSLDADLLQLGDPFSVEIDNADGRHTGKIRLFDPIKVFLQDKRVGYSWTLLYDGIVTNIHSRSTRDGDSLTISGADRGWFLNNCHVQPWVSVERSTWQSLVSAVVDSSWGFEPATIGNDVKRHVSQGRAGAVRYYTVPALTKPPPFQTDVGQSPQDVILHYAKIAKALVNVYGRTLQIFQPNYDQAPSYKIELHRGTDDRRNRGNVQSVEIEDSADGIYTETRCYSSVVAPRLEKETDNPHAGEYWGTNTVLGAIPQGFKRLHAFADPEQMGKDKCLSRAIWKYRRGLFDSWTYAAEVYGVSQGGLYFHPDTMIEIDDTVNNVIGNFYVVATRMHCTPGGGTTTTLTIKRPGLLTG